MPAEKIPDRRQENKAWREIGGKRHYFKSRWEANYAYYLEWLKQKGEIKDWFYEPDKFWFDKIKSGVTNYTPDYKVIHNRPVLNLATGKMVTIEYCEVKGFMDKKSATKINRMRIYHPNIAIRVVDKDWFKKNGPILKNIVPGWETDKTN